MPHASSPVCFALAYCLQEIMNWLTLATQATQGYINKAGSPRPEETAQKCRPIPPAQATQSISCHQWPHGCQRQLTSCKLRKKAKGSSRHQWPRGHQRQLTPPMPTKESSSRHSSSKSTLRVLNLGRWIWQADPSRLASGPSNSCHPQSCQQAR